MSEQNHTTIRVSLLPRSSRNEIVGKEGDHYRIKVTAPPVEGSANAALVALMAKRLGIPKKDIEIVSGRKSRLKMVRVSGLSEAQVTSILGHG